MQRICRARNALLTACSSVALALAACAAPAARSGDAAGAMAVYRYAGSRQCEGGGIGRAEAERQLAAAGIRAKAARCARDGKAYAAACGMSDGRLIVVDIDAKDLPAARKLGFAPLAEQPEASPASCP